MVRARRFLLAALVLSAVLLGSVQSATGTQHVSPAQAASRAKVSAYATAFQANTLNLWSVDSLLVGDWGLGMMPGTSPSIASLDNGGYQIAFQANTGHLWTVGSTWAADLGVKMRPGTSPSITGRYGGGYQIAYVGTDNMPWTIGSEQGAYSLESDWGVEGGDTVYEGTSPSITAVSVGGFKVAFQDRLGRLVVAGSWWGESVAPRGVGMRRGTSPTIAGMPGNGFTVAFEGDNTSLFTIYGADNSPHDRHLGLMDGTSPAIAPLAGGGFQIAFQANTGMLWTTGTAGTINWNKGMAAGTSPSIAGLSAGGFEVDFQANTRNLWTLGSGKGAYYYGDRYYGMQAGTNPSIAAFSYFG